MMNKCRYCKDGVAGFLSKVRCSHCGGTGIVAPDLGENGHSIAKDDVDKFLEELKDEVQRDPNRIIYKKSFINGAIENWARWQVDWFRHSWKNSQTNAKRIAGIQPMEMPKFSNTKGLYHLKNPDYDKVLVPLGCGIGAEEHVISCGDDSKAANASPYRSANHDDGSDKVPAEPVKTSPPYTFEEARIALGLEPFMVDGRPRIGPDGKHGHTTKMIVEAVAFLSRAKPNRFIVISGCNTAHSGMIRNTLLDYARELGMEHDSKLWRIKQSNSCYGISRWGAYGATCFVDHRAPKEMRDLASGSISPVAHEDRRSEVLRDEHAMLTAINDAANRIYKEHYSPPQYIICGMEVGVAIQESKHFRNDPLVDDGMGSAIREAGILMNKYRVMLDPRLDPKCVRMMLLTHNYSGSHPGSHRPIFEDVSLHSGPMDEEGFNVGK